MGINMEYAFDSNTIIHLMRGTPSVKKHREKAHDNGARFIIPPFVNYEIRRGLIIKPIPAHEKAYNVICDNCSIEEMTADVWEHAAKIYAELYNKRLTVSDADIIIAAFCIVNGYTLVTHNTKDFEHIKDLQFIDWIG
jgi:tRNA(fMet)-specific endonuclease VapC